jgi:hypothetical protein
MPLADLMNTALPMNRKERFFTGTVFPMIVAANAFQDLGALASLLPDCVLPPIVADPANTNLQFFTEYSLVESIYGEKTKNRFPEPPASKDTRHRDPRIRATNGADRPRSQDVRLPFGARPHRADARPAGAA